ncbi:MAG TPA: alpha/beta fold hydrolase, partial [Gaiellaceae bacterium]
MQLQLHEWGERTAPPLVALHGIGGFGRRFRRLAEDHLAEHFRVLAPDLRGHGFSSWEPPWTIATHVADVLETMDHAGVERATFVGHSYGGRLILELSGLDPSRIERVVLLDPAIELLPHVGFDFAERERTAGTFASPEEAIDDRLSVGNPTPRGFVEEDVREHLVRNGDGRLSYRYCRSA